MGALVGLELGRQFPYHSVAAESKTRYPRTRSYMSDKTAAGCFKGRGEWRDEDTG